MKDYQIRLSLYPRATSHSTNSVIGNVCRTIRRASFTAAPSTVLRLYTVLGLVLAACLAFPTRTCFQPTERIWLNNRRQYHASFYDTWRVRIRYCVIRFTLNRTFSKEIFEIAATADVFPESGEKLVRHISMTYCNMTVICNFVFFIKAFSLIFMEAMVYVLFSGERGVFLPHTHIHTHTEWRFLETSTSYSFYESDEMGKCVMIRWNVWWNRHYFREENDV